MTSTDYSGLGFAAGLGIGIILFALVLVVGIYIAVAIFLNKFNKLVYGKGTPMAWIPIADVYLLGKLTVNKTVGWILVACAFLNSTYTTTINGVTTTRTILPDGISGAVSALYDLAVFGLFIYAIVKYNNLKKEKAAQPATGQNTYGQPMQNQYNAYGQPVNTQAPNAMANQGYPNNMPNQGGAQAISAAPMETQYGTPVGVPTPTQNAQEQAQPNMMQQPPVKYCPQCGTQMDASIAQCGTCGYNF